ncbi:hypothetical protein GHT06_019814 [Daphnia sinensis]|uniref:Uncharacterized protein n=1 Tax=Daphnia sinensis TaxID=1820382 RepID=A0AAD5KKL9_9CRUS|nr:hypothetical protein GHT06_019814 [Daphnia sinensis]
MAFNYLSDEEFESDAEEHSHSATQQSKKRHVIHNYFVYNQRDVSSAKKSKVRESDQSTSTNQPTLLEINSKKALYAVNSKKQLRLRRRFSFFAGSTSFSSVLAENLDFKQYTIYHLGSKLQSFCDQRLCYAEHSHQECS